LHEFGVVGFCAGRGVVARVKQLIVVTFSIPTNSDSKKAPQKQVVRQRLAGLGCVQ